MFLFSFVVLFHASWIMVSVTYFGSLMITRRKSVHYLVRAFFQVSVVTVNQFARTVGGGYMYVNYQNTNMDLDISGSHSSCILNGQFRNESHQKVAKKVSKVVK